MCRAPNPLKIAPPVAHSSFESLGLNLSNTSTDVIPLVVTGSKSRGAYDTITDNHPVSIVPKCDGGFLDTFTKDTFELIDKLDGEVEYYKEYAWSTSEDVRRLEHQLENYISSQHQSNLEMRSAVGFHNLQFQSLRRQLDSSKQEIHDLQMEVANLKSLNSSGSSSLGSKELLLSDTSSRFSEASTSVSSEQKGKKRGGLVVEAFDKFFKSFAAAKRS
ncbi:hypothetical protein HDU67_010220 [Dinochytrium kinnereticum]|nr:hypothetical protein HDU67_010220 [Dinochytrium kinnereticum]